MRRPAFAIAMAVSLVAVAAPKVSWVKIRDHREGWHEVTVLYPQFSGGPLAQTASAGVSAEAHKRLREHRGYFAELTEKPTTEHYMAWEGTVGMASDRFVSVMAYCENYTGGAHGNRDYKGLNFALRNGKPRRVGLADVMLVRTTPEALATQIVLPRLKAMGASMAVEGVLESLSREQADNFVVTPAGITWLFSPYEVASYAEGEFLVKVPWSELKGKVRVDGVGG
jgi:hypothetical protein